MRLTKYRSGTSFGSSSASRELCCWELKVSKRGKLKHKQVERAMKAFWRQPMLLHSVCVCVCVCVRVCVRARYSHKESRLCTLTLHTPTWNVHVRLNPLRVNNIERVGAREGPQTTLRHERFKEKLPGSTPSIARCCGINDPRFCDTGLHSIPANNSPPDTEEPVVSLPIVRTVHDVMR